MHCGYVDGLVDVWWCGGVLSSKLRSLMESFVWQTLFLLLGDAMATISNLFIANFNLSSSFHTFNPYVPSSILINHITHFSSFLNSQCKCIFHYSKVPQHHIRTQFSISSKPHPCNPNKLINQKANKNQNRQKRDYYILSFI